MLVPHLDSYELDVRNPNATPFQGFRSESWIELCFFALLVLETPMNSFPASGERYTTQPRVFQGIKAAKVVDEVSHPVFTPHIGTVWADFNSPAYWYGSEYGPLVFQIVEIAIPNDLETPPFPTKYRRIRTSQYVTDHIS